MRTTKVFKGLFFVLLPLIFLFAVFFSSQNFLTETYAEGEEAQPAITTAEQLRTAINNALNTGTDTTIELSSNIVIDAIEVKKEGQNPYYTGINIAPEQTAPKITFKITQNITISRDESNQSIDFAMFTIKNADVVFQTEGNATLTINGGRSDSDLGIKTTPIFAVNNSKLTFDGIEGDSKNIILCNNVSRIGGCINASGAIDSSELNCSGVVFQENKAKVQGGALNLSGGTTKIEKCSFLSNISGTYGGAIYSFNGAQLEVSESVFNGNELKTGYTYDTKSQSYGGAIAVSGGTTKIEKCSFQNNTNLRGGGAVAVKGNGGAIGLIGGNLTINGATTISGCEADFGGAIAVLGGNLTVKDFEVSGNSATQEGGGLYLKSGTVKINGGTIKNNTTSAGGAQDVEWLISDDGSTYLANNIFSAKVENENNNYVIYSESDFPVGANFELGENNYVNLLAGKTIYVAKKLNTENAIIISALSSTGSIVGKPVVYFADDSAITENVFEMTIPEYNLVLGKDTQTGTNYLYVSTQYRVQFYQYYDDVLGNVVNKLSEEQRVEYNNPAVVPNPGERDGMIFTGWEAREWGDNSKPTSMTPDHITFNVVFVGTWGVEVKVEFEADGTIIGELSMVSNTAIDANTLSDYVIPTKTGYTDTAPYWAIEVDGKKIKYENQKITGDTTLFAVYVPNIMNITLKDENGIELLTLNVNYNDKLTEALPELAKDRVGYDQVEPYWAYEGTTTQFDQTEKITENIVLVATYFKNKYTITFKVNYKSSTSEFSDESLQAQTVEYLDTVDALPTPNEFEGYNPANVVWDYDDSPITENLLITGIIEINKYKVSFIANGKIVDSCEKEHFGTLTKEEIPEIPGEEEECYTQRKPQWDKDTSSEIKSNINFEAVYYLNVYTITFVLPDGTKIDREVKHGHTVDNSNIITPGFGEIVKYDKPLENITADGEIRVTTINLFMWIMIGVGVIVLAVSAFMIYKLVKRRRVIAEARKRHRHIGPYVTGDDEFN